MLQIAHFMLDISYRQIAVYDPTLAEPFNEWSQEHNDQGFSWRDVSASFGTPLQSDGPHLISVFLQRGEVEPNPDALRVIDVQCKVVNQVLEVGSIADYKQFTIPAGDYELRYEYFGMPKPEIKLIFMEDTPKGFSIRKADDEISVREDLLLDQRPGTSIDRK